MDETEWQNEYLREIFAALNLPLDTSDLDDYNGSEPTPKEPTYYIGDAPIWRNDPVMDRIALRYLDEFRNSDLHRDNVERITNIASDLDGGFTQYRREYPADLYPEND